jgi:catechol 2,3-dioxygenase-like lactoylglutathione lyase family enzyme
VASKRSVPVRLDDSSSSSSGPIPARKLAALETLRRKLIGRAVALYFVAMRVAYRLRLPWRGKLRKLDHITIPCSDRAMAERFYVGLLGAKAVNRIERALLRRIGWHNDDIDRYAAEHLSVTIADGPRLDLFLYPAGTPSESAPMHPHIAFSVSPRSFLWWMRYLRQNGVKVAGPTLPGPPGQASFYFNDPFGNHLEIITLGFTAHDLPVGVPDRSQLNYTWCPAAPTGSTPREHDAAEVQHV